jgi:hypothetical protein
MLVLLRCQPWVEGIYLLTRDVGRAPMRKRVFLSYPREAAGYVEDFAPLFRAQAGDPEVHFYGDTPVAVGDLSEELQGAISDAAVFVCFLNSSYDKSHACLKEFAIACDLQVAAGGIKSTERLLVPVVLDEQGREFWNKSTEPNGPAAWARGLLYSNLTDPRTGMHPAPIRGDSGYNGPIQRRIEDLGKKVRRTMGW